jgi:hypothetical protein
VRIDRLFTTVAAAAVLLLAGCGSDVPATGGDDPTAEVTPTGGPSSSPGLPTDDPGFPTDGPTDPGAGDPTGPTDDPTGPGGEPQPNPSDPENPVPQPTTLPGPTELTGFPEAGVESGCWLLDGYLLLGGDQELIASGREVQITGTVDETLMTTCQQGTPFRVDSVVGIEPSS